MKKRLNNTLLWVAIALLLIAAAAGFYVYQTQPARAEAARTITVQRVTFESDPTYEDFTA